MNNVQIKVLFFAKAREIVGQHQKTINTPSFISYEQLLNRIAEEFSLAEIKKNIILAVNEEFSDANEILNLKEGDVIAIIPPISGG